ncbi:MAG: DUF3387 domain-containing protein, partial [Bacteroidales bacterium]|nr:DUF3387 domain-containing protein [Bacteroidales bacterium]
ASFKITSLYCGTFVGDTPGSFVTDTPGTFVSDMTGTFGVILSAEALTNLIWDVQKEFKAGDELGIDFEEKAFYDILKELCKKYDFTYPEDKLIDLSKAVKVIVDNQAKFPDWNKRDDIKSALKVDLILILDEFGYPPVERDEVYIEIFEQAENFKKNR